MTVYAKCSSIFSQRNAYGELRAAGNAYSLAEVYSVIPRVGSSTCLGEHQLSGHRICAVYSAVDVDGIRHGSLSRVEGYCGQRVAAGSGEYIRTCYICRLKIIGVIKYHAVLIYLAVIVGFLHLIGEYVAYGRVVIRKIEISVHSEAGAPAVLDEPCAVSGRGYDKVAFAEIVVPANDGDGVIRLGLLVLVEGGVAGSSFIMINSSFIIIGMI